MIVVIDDAKECGWADIVARNADAGLLVLGALQGNIEELYIDFDLGQSVNGLQMLIDAVKNEIELPNKIIIISMNPSGIKAIKNFILDNGYQLESGSGCRFEKIIRFPALGTPEDQDIEAVNQDNVPYPICPLNMYFEGDEDKCDTSKCDFENRTCTEACARFYKDKNKEHGHHIVDLGGD